MFVVSILSLVLKKIGQPQHETGDVMYLSGSQQHFDETAMTAGGGALVLHSERRVISDSAAVNQI